MQSISFSLAGEAKTVEFGSLMSKLCTALCTKLHRSVLVTLEGDLGAGKTTFSRGFILECGYKDIVRSPTYTLVETYDFADYSVYHFDLYRLLDPEELEYMGIRDYFQKTSVSLVEWPDKAQGMLPDPDVRVYFSYNSEFRDIVIESDLIDRNDLNAVKDALEKVSPSRA